MTPAHAMDEMADWAATHAERVQVDDPVPVGEVIELPEGVAQRMWQEALETVW